MRLVRVLVPDDRRADACAVLDDADFDYFVTPGADEFADESIVEVPVSDEGVGDVIDALSGVGVDLDRYSVVEEAEWVATPNAEPIRERYAETYDRPTSEELRSLVDKLNWDVRSFLMMLSLSAFVSAVGLVLDSPVMVVGSAVLAPLVNPMLVAGTGTILGERQMVADGLRLQALGLVVGVASAFAVGLAVEGLALAPSTLDLSVVDAVATRFAPSGLVVLVGVAAGGAAVVSLTAESSLINIVGVMVAAALVPAAAATGLALAWGYPSVALGSGLLVVATVVAIDLAIVATFRLLGYRPSGELLTARSRSGAWRMAGVALVLGVIVVGTGAATAGQVAFERDVNAALDDVLTDPEYEGVSTVAVRTEYADYSPFTGPETVLVEVSRPDGEAYPDLPDRLADRIAEATGRAVDVRVEYVDRGESTGGGG